jgi:predicted dehydrogenase
MGAGQIASGFDSPNVDEVLTHAHAYIKHNGFNLIGFYDVDSEKAELAAQKWSCDSFDNISAIKDRIDVVSICTPDNRHVAAIKQAVELHPKLIFLEKPITNNLSDVEYLMKIAESIPIAVNYSRRYVIEFQELSANISSDKFGAFISGIGYCGKGFVHNGSHMIDLLRFMIGEIKSIEKVSAVADFYNEDPSVNAVIYFQNGSEFIMRAIPCSNFTIFEVDLIFQKARIRILDSGFKIDIYSVENDERFNGYRKLQKSADISTKLSDAMLSAVDNIYCFLENGEKLRCGISDGYEAIKYA